MSDDMLSEMFEEAEIRYGRRPTSSEYAREFALHGVDARVNLLKRLEKNAPLNLSEAAERHDYISKMKEIHHALRKVGR
jgi:hypothetical protein